jgi:acylphosphatase
MKRLRLVVSGSVQGVFYRDFTHKQAEELGLKGYVRNMRDGTVEAVLEGEERALKELAKRCWKGPQFSKVAKVEEEWSEATGGFSDFSVRY